MPVIAAVATRTRTMANALLTARVLSKLPENRRDAFRQTVERLRDRSDRLEAPSEPAAMLCATYESYCTENPSDRGWEAFEKTMLHAREWRDEGYVEPFNIRESLSIAVADEYRAGRVLTVQQVRDQLAWMPGRDAWLREAFVQNHHVVPKNDVLLEMLKIKHVNDGLSREQPRAMVDTLEGSMPALPMDVDSHVVGVHSIHRIIDRLAREEPPDSIADWRQLLNDSYTEFADLQHPDIQPVIRAVRDRALDWLSSPEVGLP